MPVIPAPNQTVTIIVEHVGGFTDVPCPVGDYFATHVEDPSDVPALIERIVDGLLAETDWYIIREIDNGMPTPEAIKQYRQALRELPDGSPALAVFPLTP